MVKSALHIIKHPLIQHKLTQMRRRETPTAEFRQLLREIALLLGYEVTRDLELENVPIDTPLAHCMAPMLKGKKLVLVSILRAGEGLVQGMLDLIPSARIAHIGLYRDHKSLQPVEYYFKAPEDIASRLVIVADPMLATGHSAAAALSKLKKRGADNLRFVALLAAPEGIAYLQKHHADVPLYVAAIDEKLDENGYIVPGLGDAGDRLFGTK